MGWVWVGTENLCMGLGFTIPKMTPNFEPSCGWGNSMLGRTHKETHTYKPEKKHCCAAGDNLA